MRTHQIDGLSGATITSRGVSNAVRYWLKDGFGPFLQKLDTRKAAMAEQDPKTNRTRSRSINNNPIASAGIGHLFGSGRYDQTRDVALTMCAAVIAVLGLLECRGEFNPRVCP